MFSLPEPCKRKKCTVSITAIAFGAVMLMALAVGGLAISSAALSAATPLHAAMLGVDTKSTKVRPDKQNSGAFSSVAIKLPKWPEGSGRYRLLTSAPFPQFLAAIEERSTPVSGQADPRLIRDGHSWAFSDAFTAQVGADPWALPGIGFPNIETHSSRVVTNYKPYQAVVDWVPADSGNDAWEPVPAVYCMGLTTEQIAKRASRHERQILSYAIEHGVSASLVKAVITKESCFNTRAVSKAGAEGLMQLMPETARWLKVTDRSDVNQNLKAGIRYLSDLRKRFGTEELALAAYNAGPGNVERHGGIPPFAETQQYVESVMAHYRRYAATTRFANQQVSY